MRVCVLSTVLIVTASLINTTDAESLKRRPDADFKASSSLRYTLVRVLPHAADHFTQGLAVDDGLLLESTGGYGQSALIAERLGRVEPLREQRLPVSSFGEGLSVFAGEIFQLTWREQTVRVWSHDFKLLRTMPYAGEGWGLTHDGAQLIMSDGSARLRFRNPRDFAVTRTIEVRDGTASIERLNELEYAQGLIFANVWQTDRIAIIDPVDGKLLAWLDLQALRAQLPAEIAADRHHAVLNGIAYDPLRDSFYVTGKNWPRIFELKLHGLPDGVGRSLRSSVPSSLRR